MAVTHVERLDPEDHMLVPLTPYEVVYLMRSAGLAMEVQPDAILASAFAWLRDSNHEFLRTHPEKVPHLRDLIHLMEEVEHDPYE